MIIRNILILLSIWFTILLDLYSKNIALSKLWEVKIDLISDYIWLKLTFNTWIAFSLPIEWLLLKIITIIIFLIIIYYYIIEEYKKNNIFTDISFILILWWAFWNWYERIFNWKVIDFIYVKYFSVFNFADSFIFIWIFLFLTINILSWINNKNDGTFWKRKRVSFLTK